MSERSTSELRPAPYVIGDGWWYYFVHKFLHTFFYILQSDIHIISNVFIGSKLYKLFKLNREGEKMEKE